MNQISSDLDFRGDKSFQQDEESRGHYGAGDGPHWDSQHHLRNVSTTRGKLL